MQPDFTPLHKAIARLEAGLTRHLSDPSDEEVRDGLIQRFEFTYDLAPKMLRRALEAGADSPAEIDQMTFPTLIRTAAEKGLVKGGWPAWRDFRDMRNTTSHTYDEAKAISVAARIPAFLSEVQYLAERLTASIVE